MGCSPPGSSVHGDSPGKNTGVGHQALIQGIFQTQGLNPPLLCLLHWWVCSSTTWEDNLPVLRGIKNNVRKKIPKLMIRVQETLFSSMLFLHPSTLNFSLVFFFLISRDFHGSPVPYNLLFLEYSQRRRPALHPWSGYWILHAATKSFHAVTKDLATEIKDSAGYK